MKRLGMIVLTAALAVCLTACGGISKSVDLKYGETYKIEDEKLTEKENLTWESEDSSIVSVSDDGTVTANAPGKAKVSIKEGDKSIGTYIFDVTIVPIEQIIFADDHAQVTEKSSDNKLKYTLLPENASDYGIKWTSADDSVASINENGVITANAVGKTTIVATTENGVTAQCSLEVVARSAYDQLSRHEKAFVNAILPIMSNFKNPASVRFTAIYGMGDYWRFEASAQNGFGGNTISSYTYFSSTGLLLDSSASFENEMNVDLVTQAVHEKLGY